MRIILSLLLLCFFSLTTYAQEEKKFVPPPKPGYAALQMTGVEQAGDIIDPLRIRLHDGRIIQLAGIDIPDLTPYDTGDIGLAAMALLERLLANKHVRIYQGKSAKARLNRMGYHLAHLEERGGETWIQGALIANGLARVRPSSLNTEMAAQMTALEQQARSEKRGLWANEQYAVLTPETAGEAMHGWAIVEGTVRASAMARNTVYLNFGDNWRNDFTIGIPSAVRRDLANAGIDPLAFAHKKVRARGWVEDYNGPYIELLHPVWIEILPAGNEQSTLPEGN